MAVDGITATYIAANQFSVTGNQTADFHAGRRVKAELTGGDVYSTISGSVFGAVTTVTLYDSELDNTLTKVWYGIGWGSEGSLPDHTHDSSEGSGAQFTSLVFLAPATIGVPDNTDLITLSSGVVTFDSPITIGNSDLGNVAGSVRWTGADLEYNDGIAWQSLTGGGGSFLARDGSTTLTGDWNFGSFTISGTGDIWCNDLHTAGASLYIGDVQLTSDANVLNYGSNTISGTGDVAAGRVALGSFVDLDLYTSNLNIINESGSFGWGAFYKYFDSSAGSAPGYYKARGTYASPAAVQAADVVGGWNAYAHDGSQHDLIGRCRHIVESISSGNVKSYIEFHVSDASGVLQEMARLNSTGLIVGDGVNQQSDYTIHMLDNSPILSLEGDGSTSDAEIRLERQNVAKWHILNDATGIEADVFRLYAESSGWDSLRISNASYGVGIGFAGANAPDATRLTVIADEAISTFTMKQYYDGSGGAAFSGYKARGGDQDAPTVVVVDDVITGYNAFVYDGSGWDDAGKIRHRVEAVSSGDVASYIEIYTSDTSGTSREVVRINSEGALLVGGDFSNANMTIGLTIDMAANTDEAFAIKSSSVAHGMTTQAETDTFSNLKKIDNTAGGLRITGFSATGTTMGAILRGVVTDEETGKTSSDYAAILLSGATKTGTTFGSMGANANILAIANNATTVMLVDVEGDTWQTGAATIGTTSSTISGTIRYTGSDFEGYHGGQWMTLTASGGGTNDHSALNELDYASAGHTGFVSIATDQIITGAKTFTQDVTISGSLTATASGTFGYLEVTDSISEIQFTAASGTIGMSDHTDLMTLTSGIVYFDGHIRTTVSGAYDIGTLDTPFRDIYLTGGSVYLDSEKISSPSPGVLDFGGASIENATNLGNAGNLKFVRSYEVETGGVEDTFDITIPQTADILVVHAMVRSDKNDGEETAGLSFNNDSSSGNYNVVYSMQRPNSTLGSTAVDGHDKNYITFSHSASAYSGPSGYYTSVFMTIPFYRDTDKNKVATIETQYDWSDNDGTDTGIARIDAHGHWMSTAAITSLQLFINSGNLDAGSKIVVYGYSSDATDIEATYDRGRQELFIEHATTSGINILPGRIDIEDGSSRYALSVSGTLFKESLSLSASTWYYVYAKPPVSGNYLSESEIELSTTAPTRDTTKMGYYHGSNTDWRCFSLFYSDSNSEVHRFFHYGNKITFEDYVLLYDDDTPSDTWTDQTVGVPIEESMVTIRWDYRYVDAAGSAYWRVNGQTAESQWVGYIDDGTTANRRGSYTRDIRCDSSGKIETRFNVSTTNIFRAYTEAIILPDWIAPK